MFRRFALQREQQLLNQSPIDEKKDPAEKPCGSPTKILKKIEGSPRAQKMAQLGVQRPAGAGERISQPMITNPVFQRAEAKPSKRKLFAEPEMSVSKKLKLEDHAFLCLNFSSQEIHEAKREVNDHRKYLYVSHIKKTKAGITKLIVWDIDETLLQTKASQEAKKCKLKHPEKTRELISKTREGVAHMVATSRRPKNEKPTSVCFAEKVLNAVGNHFDRLYYSASHLKVAILMQLAEELGMTYEDIVLVDDRDDQLIPAGKAGFTVVKVHPTGTQHLDEVDKILEENELTSRYRMA
jgi:beta-phosphoglucomutase-like phosphatase (HAD superfamily)